MTRQILNTKKQPVKRRKGAPLPPKRENSTLLIAGGIVAILLVALLIGVNVINASQAKPYTPVTAAGRTWGNPNAKVTLDEWSDFQ